MKPGIYRNIPEAEYHALPYLGSTTMKAFKKNALSSQIPFEPSDLLQKTLDLGSATHMLSLEGREAFDRKFFVAPECDKRTTAGKQMWEMIKAHAAGRTLLDKAQGEAVEGMVKSLYDNEASKIMLNRGANEVTCIWQDKETGIMCKARPDDYSNDCAMDLKTCSDIQWFHRDIYKYGYEIQDAHYSEGLIQNGAPVDIFYFIAVQSSGTFPVRVGHLTYEHREAAKQEWRRLLNLYAECKSKGFPNIKIPEHIYSLDQLTANDLVEEW